MSNKNKPAKVSAIGPSMPPEQAPMTMKEAFYASQENFNAESVAQYVEDAPLRELFNRAEDIKELMQRKIDLNEKECVFPTTFYFDTTSEDLLEFFGGKGFEIGIESDADGKAEVTLKWE